MNRQTDGQTDMARSTRLVILIKNIYTLCIRARRDCESERARQSGCRLSVACETQTKYTRQQFRRQETGERLQEAYSVQKLQ